MPATSTSKFVARPDLEGPKVPKLNIKLLKKLGNHVLDDPRRIDMGTWIGSLFTELSINRSASPERIKEEARWDGVNVEKEYPACKTKGCRSGWAILLSHPQKDWPRLERQIARNEEGGFYPGMKLLGLTVPEAHWFFFGRTSRGEKAALSTQTDIATLIQYRKEKRVLPTNEEGSFVKTMEEHGFHQYTDSEE